jgi:hypothetical protein
MIKGKAKWRAALLYLFLAIGLSGVVCIAVDLIWHRSWVLADPWALLPMLCSLLIERAAKFPFGPDYICRTKAGMADWAIRMLWIISIALYIGSIWVLVSYGLKVWDSTGSLLFYFGFGLSFFPGDGKFRLHDPSNESKPPAKEKVLA